jgi:hypothetical protein
LALVAEIVSGEIGRALGLAVPELVFMELDPAIGRNEADPEIQDLLMASVGLNVGMDFLPGSLMFDPAAGDKADPELASRIVWFDAFVSNVDRTAKNANLLLWHKKLYLVDHGASLFFHHNWQPVEEMALRPFFAIRDHILLPWASRIREVDAGMRERLSEPVLRDIVSTVPSEWFSQTEGPSAEGYLSYFGQRLLHSAFAEEAARAYDTLI